MSHTSYSTSTSSHKLSDTDIVSKRPIVKLKRARTNHKSRIRNVLVRAESIGLVVDIYYITRENEIVVGSKWKSLPLEYSVKTLQPIADSEDLQQIVSMNDWTNRELVIKRLKAGQQCILLLRNDQKGNNIVGYTWARFDKTDEPGCDYKLLNNEAFLHGAFIHEGYRDNGLGTFFRAQIYQLLKKQGITHFVSTTDVLNPAAKRFKAKLGAYNFARFCSIRWYDRSLFTFKSCLHKHPTQKQTDELQIPGISRFKT